MRPRRLDGAMGTALLSRGLPTDCVPERWLLERPDEVAAVHAAHAEAGADLLLTCSFNLAAPDRLGRGGAPAPLAELAGRAVEAACVSPDATVAGAVGPAALVPPGGAGPGPAALQAAYRPAFRALAEAGADLLWAESQFTLREALAALDAARLTGLPAVVTLTFGAPAGDSEPTLPGGEPVESALLALVNAGAAAVGVNCVLPGVSGLEPLLARLAPRLEVPLVAKPSAGLPGAVLSPPEFAGWVRRLRDAGAAWVGGCCGASPAHLRALHRE